MPLFMPLSQLLMNPTCSEREIHALLKKELKLVTGLFANSWNYAKAYSEVSFGADFRADFVVLCANSGYWNAHIVELKRPGVNLYLKSGKKSDDLQLVERQLAERKDWRRQNEQAFRQALAKLLPHNAAAQCSHASQHNLAKSEILDSRTVIHMEGHAIIGRSTAMSCQERERRRLDDQRANEWGSPQVLTYDRVLAWAEKMANASSAGL